MFNKALKTIILGLFLWCEQKTIVLNDTKDLIAFERNHEAGNIWDFDVWLINLKTNEEIRLTKNLNYWEYAPTWLNDSELIYLIEPQEKAMTETDIVLINCKTGKRNLLDFWSWRNDPGMNVTADSLGNCYYTDDGLDALYKFSLKEKKHCVEEILSAESLNKLGLGELVKAIVASNGAKLLLVASDSIKYRQSRAARRFYYDDIYLYDLKNRVLERLTTGDSTYEDPAWIGNDSIIFTSNCDGNYDLYILELRSKKIIRLTSTPEVSETQPAVAPDRRRVVYTRYDKKKKRDEIWIMDLVNRKTYYLTEGSNPTWSPTK